MAKRAVEIIADHLGLSVEDLRDYRYQPRTGEMPVFATGDYDYWCCPAGRRRPPDGYRWQPVQNDYLAVRYPGRTIYWASGAPEQE